MNHPTLVGAVRAASEEGASPFPTERSRSVAPVSRLRSMESTIGLNHQSNVDLDLSNMVQNNASSILTTDCSSHCPCKRPTEVSSPSPPPWDVNFAPLEGGSDFNDLLEADLMTFDREKCNLRPTMEWMRDTSESGRVEGAPPPVSLDDFSSYLHPVNINGVLRELAIALRGEKLTFLC